MALETATYVSQLTATNPVHTDGLNAMDAHLRLIKSALLATFAGFTAAPLASSQAAIDAAVAAVSTNGVAMLADAGAFFKTNTTDGLTNPSAGSVGVKTGGTTATTFSSTGLSTAALATSGPATVGGSLTVTGAISGPGVVPLGGSIVWWSDTLPDASWAWCNGATYLRSNTALFAVLGTKYGVGDGSTTANLPDLRDRVPVGKGTMGATSAIGLITQYVTSTIGTLIGEAKHLLTLLEIPTGLFTLNDPGHHHTGRNTTQTNARGPGPGDSLGDGGTSTVVTSTDSSGVSLTDHAGGTSHNIVQPGIVCNWIIRVS